MGEPSLEAAAGFGEFQRQPPPFLTFPPVRRGQGTLINSEQLPSPRRLAAGRRA